MDLTIGMTVYDESDAAICTLHALVLYHQEVLPQCELLVIDNHPGTRQSKRIVDTCTWLHGGSQEAYDTIAKNGLVPFWKPKVGKVSYYPFPSPRGTSLSRQEIFLRAAAPAVVCIDAHVLLPPGTLARLIRWYQDHPDTMDLYQGPLEMDNHVSIATHLDDVWRDDMWGTWATDPRGVDPEAPPFEIPAQGLGLFSCRKEAWIRFPEGLRGFGGEEHMLHAMWRQAGRKIYCLPWLRWWHLFRDTTAPSPYPMNIHERIRNYIIWGKHLNYDLSRLHDHFVHRNVISEAAWQALVANPDTDLHQVQTRPAPGAPGAAPSGCSSCGQPHPNISLGGLYDSLCREQSDLNQHLPKLKELASQCRHVTEITQRHQSTIALLAGQPDRLVSFNTAGRASQIVTALGDRRGKTEVVFGPPDALAETAVAEPTDMLFIDEIQHSDRVWAQLQKFASQCSHYIVFHDTQIYGERGPNGHPGILPAVRRWLKDHPEWSVVYHTNEQYGLTVLSCRPEDKPKLPSLVKMAWNYAKALSHHVMTGSEIADPETIQARLDTCSLCPHRVDNRCSICGCYLDAGPDGREGKAVWKDSICPIGKW